MMTKRKSIQGTKAKALVLLPVATVLFLMISCNNSGTKKETVSNIVEMDTTITIKKQLSKEKLILCYIKHKNTTDIGLSANGGNVTYIGESKNPKILYIVDGVKSSNETTILNIEQKKIELYGVGLRDREEEKKIKQEGYDAVIWLTTKKL